MEREVQPTPLTGLLTTVRALIEGIRPKQWTKNLIIFFALFFTISESWDPSDPGLWLSLLGKTALAFVLFSGLSGAVYLVNDVFDVEKDRSHPKKRLRPIASGRLHPMAAMVAAGVLIAAGLALSFMLSLS
ncbi:MAG: decaprenyl-phosphate phosphoribosyltransferase, partial [SAR202 cluster bacterium]|nr:decaprenyl-phosphate phosphoribosyltransferase [SAR202 cluster bacterium]